VKLSSKARTQWCVITARRLNVVRCETAGIWILVPEVFYNVKPILSSFYMSVNHTYSNLVSGWTDFVVIGVYAPRTRRSSSLGPSANKEKKRLGCAPALARAAPPDVRRLSPERRRRVRPPPRPLRATRVRPLAVALVHHGRPGRRSVDAHVRRPAGP